MVSTPLKNISQIGNLPQIGVKIKNIWNHHLEQFVTIHYTSWLERDPYDCCLENHHKAAQPKMGRAGIILKDLSAMFFWQAQLVILVQGPKI